MYKDKKAMRGRAATGPPTTVTATPSSISRPSAQEQMVIMKIIR